MDEKPKGRFETTKLFEENTGEKLNDILWVMSLVGLSVSHLVVTISFHCLSPWHTRPPPLPTMFSCLFSLLTLNHFEP